MLDLLDFDAIEVPDIEAPAAEASADIQASTDKPRRGRRPGTPNRPKEKQPLPRLGYRIGELAEMLGVSRAAIYRAIKAGTIKPTKLGKNTLISVEEAQRILRPRR